MKKGWTDKKESYEGVVVMEIPFDDDIPCGPGECGPPAKRKTKVRNEYSKCELGYYENALKLAKDKITGEYDIKKFPVDMPLARKERTVQQKLVEHMAMKLFTQQSIFSLVDILFADMMEDQKDLDREANQDPEEESEESNSTPSGNDDEEEDENEDDFDDPTKYGVDIEDYVGLKGTLTIERIKDIVGEVMSTCQAKLEYEILEYIIKGKVFESKVIRESFL